jgi:hypothetical protein
LELEAVQHILDRELGEHGQNRHGAQPELARRPGVGPEVSNVLDAQIDTHPDDGAHRRIGHE